MGEASAEFPRLLGPSKEFPVAISSVDDDDDDAMAEVGMCSAEVMPLSQVPRNSEE